LSTFSRIRNCFITCIKSLLEAFGEHGPYYLHMPVPRKKDRLKPHVQGKWKHFERLVAAIHKAADSGATVRRDEQINGRQFDVTIRFRRGLYEHLTVVECKDYKHAVPVEKVDALVTKARDVHANVSVLASTKGFQSGAKECAKRHGVTLLHVKQGISVDLSVFGATWGKPIKMLHIECIGLEYSDGRIKELPSEANVLTYYAHHVVLERDGVRTHLDAFINRQLNAAAQTADYVTHRLDVPQGTRIVAPSNGEIPLETITAVNVKTAFVEGKTIVGPYKFDPVILNSPVDVENVDTGETTSFDYMSLPLGIGNTFVAGRFYEAAGLGFFYYCEAVRNNLAELWMVESFQHGNLIQAKLQLEIKYAERYIEVNDSTVTKRLERRRLTMIDRQSSSSHDTRSP